MKRIGKHKLYRGDCLKVLRKLPDNSIDSIVTDPPYGISFMGKKWDYDVPTLAIWEECLRVLKPGGYLLAFAGTRTQHRMAVRIEDAGFEIKDMLAWCYSGQATPMSQDISKAIDKAAGAKRKVVGVNTNHRNNVNSKHQGTSSAVVTAPATKAARKWEGFGTGLKPCYEPVTMARKPIPGKTTIAENIQRYGTGGINIDGCRFKHPKDSASVSAKGRWPTNMMLGTGPDIESVFGDNSRFYYCAKPSKAERGEGNNHETVKPISLMQWLTVLVTQPGGVVLDPFMGSGTTGIACERNRFRFVGIERELPYFKIAKARIREARRYRIKTAKTAKTRKNK